MRTRSILASAVLGLALAVPATAQELRLNRTIETLQKKQPVFGLFTADLSLQNAQSLARSDLDFLFIDMEHSPFDLETLRTFLLGMIDVRTIVQKGSPQMNVTPLVRIPMNGRENLQFLVKQVLDVGAFGIVFPFVSSKEQAENAVKSMRYPASRNDPQQEPRGTRGSSPTNAAWFWGARNYSQVADVYPLDPQGELLAVLQIESQEGVENIEAITSVPGVSAIFIGPSDLSISYGVPGSHEDEVKAIQKVLDVCKAKGIPCGLTTGARDVAQRLEQGFDFVTIGYWNDAGISPAPSEALGIARKASGRDGQD
jgi:4-hydroxy-2-oxoheptanedioate aldolase